jgi:hypothetical protein
MQQSTVPTIEGLTSTHCQQMHEVKLCRKAVQFRPSVCVFHYQNYERSLNAILSAEFNLLLYMRLRSIFSKLLIIIKKRTT